MTTNATTSRAHAADTRPPTDTVRAGRWTGLAYLSLAVTGMLGFLVLRPQIFTDDAAATLANLSERPELASTVVLLEMGVVLSQALVAIGFYRLLREVRPVAAFAVATFGLMNAAAIMASGAFMGAAAAVGQDPSIVAGADAAGVVGTLTQLSEASWGMGNLFFGLWLIPMGWAAITTARFPVVMGWILVVGGVGYVVSGLLAWGVAAAPSWLAEAAAMPATVGELWMIGYLLTVGIRGRSVEVAVRSAQ